MCVGFRVFIHLSWWSGKLSELRKNFDVIKLLGSFLTNFLFCFCLFILTWTCFALHSPIVSSPFLPHLFLHSLPRALLDGDAGVGGRANPPSRRISPAVTPTSTPFRRFPSPSGTRLLIVVVVVCGLSHIQRKVVIEYSSHAITFYSNCVHVQFVVFVRERI